MTVPLSRVMLFVSINGRMQPLAVLVLIDAFALRCRALAVGLMNMHDNGTCYADLCHSHKKL